MLDSPDFYISEIRGDRFTDFCVHTARFSGNWLQKVGRLEKIGQWDHGIKRAVDGMNDGLEFMEQHQDFTADEIDFMRNNKVSHQRDKWICFHSLDNNYKCKYFLFPQCIYDLFYFHAEYHFIVNK